MKDDLYYYYTQNIYNYANVLMARIENLKKGSNNSFNYQRQSIIFSNKKNLDLNVYMTQKEFDFKYDLINKFLNDIFNSNKKIKKSKSKSKKHQPQIHIKDNSSSDSLFKVQSNSSSNYNVRFDENDTKSIESFNDSNSSNLLIDTSNVRIKTIYLKYN